MHGWSEWSNISEVKSNGIADAGLPPTTIINNQNVKVAWTEPNDNYEQIYAYQVLLKQSDGDYSELSTFCDGSNQVSFELKACEIPLQKLMEEPYNLQAGDRIVAKFAAINANGMGPLSEPTDNGAQIKTVPMAMA